MISLPVISGPDWSALHKGGRTAYIDPGDAELTAFGCCQNDWGKALSFMGRGSVIKKTKKLFNDDDCNLEILITKLQ